MGIVYRAVCNDPSRNLINIPCAIKILSPDLSNEFSLQKRFEREISILRKLKHPHIVKYFGGGKTGTQRFYAMELVTGGSLEGLLKKRSRLSWEEALEYANQVAVALEHAHREGVVHRDLKPANLLLTENLTLKLTDFGIARDTQQTALTAAGRTVGTYAYMAPEQIRGKPPVDGKTDLYALGCLLYEMIAGETPFVSENGGDLLMQHLQEQPPRITSVVPTCPEPIEELIFDLLEKEPGNRPYDALAVQASIAKVRKTIYDQAVAAASKPTAIATLVATSDEATTTTKTTKKKKKKKKVEETPFYEHWGFLGGCLALLIGLVVYFSLPASLSVLLARSESLMKSTDPGDWKVAHDGPLAEILKRFPQGDHVESVQEMYDQYEIHRAEKQARSKANRGKDLTEPERLFIKAERYEQIGDRISAIEKYESMIELLKDRQQDRAFVQLANKQIARIKASGGDKVDRVQILNDSLDKADRLLADGNKLEARTIWDSIIELYSGNQELEPLVTKARDRKREN